MHTMVNRILEVLDKYCKSKIFWLNKLKLFQNYVFLSTYEHHVINCVQKVLKLDLDRYCTDSRFRSKVKNLIKSYLAEIEKCIESC